MIRPKILLILLFCFSSISCASNDDVVYKEILCRNDRKIPPFRYQNKTEVKYFAVAIFADLWPFNEAICMNISLQSDRKLQLKYTKQGGRARGYKEVAVVRNDNNDFFFTEYPNDHVIMFGISVIINGSNILISNCQMERSVYEHENLVVATSSSDVLDDKEAKEMIKTFLHLRNVTSATVDDFRLVHGPCKKFRSPDSRSTTITTRKVEPLDDDFLYYFGGFTFVAIASLLICYFFNKRQMRVSPI